MFGKTKTNDNEDMGVSETGSSRKKIFIIIGIILAFLLIIGGEFWWWTSKEAEKKTQAEKAKAEAESGCGEITTEDGKYEGAGPYSPVVMAKISGNYPKGQEICEWTVNGEDFGKSEPYGEYCIRYGLTFYHKEDYTISYKVNGLKNCPKSKTLKVTSLTPEEDKRQKEALQKLLNSGLSPEEIEAAENHKMRQYVE